VFFYFFVRFLACLESFQQWKSWCYRSSLIRDVNCYLAWLWYNASVSKMWSTCDGSQTFVQQVHLFLSRASPSASISDRSHFRAVFLDVVDFHFFPNLPISPIFLFVTTTVMLHRIRGSCHMAMVLSFVVIAITALRKMSICQLPWWLTYLLTYCTNSV